MKPMFKGLDTETQLLVGIGAAIASGCIPCLEKMTKLADKAGIDAKKIKASAIIGQYVKDQPVAHMKTAADNLLGTHLLKSQSATECPVDRKGNENVGCGCN